MAAMSEPWPAGVHPHRAADRARARRPPTRTRSARPRRRPPGDAPAGRPRRRACTARPLDARSRRTRRRARTAMPAKPRVGDEQVRALADDQRRQPGGPPPRPPPRRRSSASAASTNSAAGPADPVGGERAERDVAPGDGRRARRRPRRPPRRRGSPRRCSRSGLEQATIVGQRGEVTRAEGEAQVAGPELARQERARTSSSGRAATPRRPTGGRRAPRRRSACP